MNNNTSILVLLCLLLFVNVEMVEARNEKSGIKEFWQELYIYKTINTKWKGEIFLNNLYSKKLGNYDWFLEGKVSYSASKWLAIEGMYRHEFYDLDGKKVQEYRPMTRFVGKHNLGIWTFRNRHRFELRMFEVGENKFRYRTDLKIKPNFDWTPIMLNPYLQEEIFIGEKGLSRNRIYLGIEGKYSRVEPAVYSLIQSDKIIGSWNNRFIVGFMLGIEL